MIAATSDCQFAAAAIHTRKREKKACQTKKKRSKSTPTAG